jgi:hypothetical protein
MEAPFENIFYLIVPQKERINNKSNTLVHLSFILETALKTIPFH